MVALEIFLAAPAGRYRALRWLESPVESASEAPSGTPLQINSRGARL